MGNFFGDIFGVGKAPPAPLAQDVPSPPKALDDQQINARRLAELARAGRDSLVRDPGIHVPQGSQGISNPQMPVL